MGDFALAAAERALGADDPVRPLLAPLFSTRQPILQTGPPVFSACWAASSGVQATPPSGTAMP